MNRVRAQATALLPEPAIGQDTLDQMTACIPKMDAPKEGVPAGCIAMQSQLAMARVRTKVDPVIAPVVLQAMLTNTSSVLVRVRVRIDEKGNVAATQIEGEYPFINDAVKDAVRSWKFIPAIIQNEPRCVDTSFTIEIKLNR
jgi:TonB family protein